MLDFFRDFWELSWKVCYVEGRRKLVASGCLQYLLKLHMHRTWIGHTWDCRFDLEPARNIQVTKKIEAKEVSLTWAGCDALGKQWDLVPNDTSIYETFTLPGTVLRDSPSWSHLALTTALWGGCYCCAYTASEDSWGSMPVSNCLSSYTWQSWSSDLNPGSQILKPWLLITTHSSSSIWLYLSSAVTALKSLKPRGDQANSVLKGPQ